MRNKLNRVLLVLLVLQLGVLVVSRLAGTATSKPVKPRKLLAQLDAKRVQSITIAGDDAKQKPVELRKLPKSGKWVLASGGDYPVSKNKVDELLGKLAALTARAPVADKPTYHHTLEVAAEKHQRKVTLVSGKGERTTFFLGSSPGLKKVHFRFDGKPEVYAAQELSAWDVGATAGDWIETQYFKVERDAIVAVSLRNAHGTIELEKVGDKWQLKGLPQGKQLKQSEVDALLGSASSIFMADPVSSKLEQRFGLAQPTVRLTVTTEAKAKVEPTSSPASAPASAPASQPTAVARGSRTLLLGAKDGDAYFAKSDSSRFVVRITSATASELVDKKPADFVEDPKAKDKDKGGTEAGAPPPRMPRMPGMPTP